MSVFLALISIIALLRIILINQKPGVLSRKAYCISIGFAYFLIAALRHYSVGIDTIGYTNSFYVIRNTTWTNLSFSKDPVYWYFVKTISLFTDDHQLYLAIVAGVFAFSISLFIYKYSDEPALSFFSLLPFSYFYFSMTGLRQTMAMSVLLFAYKYLRNRSFLKFVSIVAIASFFHLTALVFVVAFFVSLIRINYRYIYWLIVSSFLIYAFRAQIVRFLIQYFVASRNYEFVPIAGGGGVTTLIAFVIVLLFALFFRRSVIEKDASSDILYNMLIVAIFFQMLVPLSPNIFRIAMYFSIFNILLIPKVINSIKDDNLRLLGYSITVCLLGIQYFVFTSKAAGIIPYRFFWQ